jgi:hypothetical protein
MDVLRHHTLLDGLLGERGYKIVVDGSGRPALPGEKDRTIDFGSVNSEVMNSEFSVTSPGE